MRCSAHKPKDVCVCENGERETREGSDEGRRIKEKKKKGS